VWGGDGGDGEYTRMVEDGKVIESHAYKFEGGLIALRSDSLQIYTVYIQYIRGPWCVCVGGGVVMMEVGGEGGGRRVNGGRFKGREGRVIQRVSASSCVVQVLFTQPHSPQNSPPKVVLAVGGPTPRHGTHGVMRVKVCHRSIPPRGGIQEVHLHPFGVRCGRSVWQGEGASLSLLILLSLTSCYYALALFFFQIQMREKSGLWSIQKTFKPCFLFCTATD
jgi:hypothetical protein